MSNSEPSARATCAVRAASRLTPRLILPALTMVAWRAAASILASSASERPVVPMTWTMRALSRQRGEFDGRGRRGEVEHAVDLGKEGQGIVGDGDAERLESRHLADIAAERGRALGLDAAGDRAARGLGQHAGQRLAHAPGSSQHGNFHVTHGGPPSHAKGAEALLERTSNPPRATFYAASHPAHKPPLAMVLGDPVCTRVTRPDLRAPAPIARQARRPGLLGDGALGLRHLGLGLP